MGFRNSSQFETNALESKEIFAKYLKPGLTKNSTKIRIGNTSYLQHRLLLNLVFSRHSATVHLYYLQLRQDILQNVTHCPDNTCVKLAGLALQGEYGPYRAEYHRFEYFKPEHYLPGRVSSYFISVNFENLIWNYFSQKD